MLGSTILEVTVGMMLVFMVLSVLCTALLEAIRTGTKKRAKELEKGISEMLGAKQPASDGTKGTDWVSELYNHSLVYALFEGQYVQGKRHNPNLPSYIPARTFALALLDLVIHPPIGAPAVTPDGAPSTTAVVADFEQAVGRLPDGSKLKRALRPLAATAAGDLEKLQANVEGWYDATMDRISGRFKRSSQKLLLAVGFILAVLLNVDSIRIAQYLSTNPTARAAYVAQAERQTLPENPTIAEAVAGMQVLKLPIGWDGYGVRWTMKPGVDPHPFILSALAGWLMTALAVSLGAPFWFDLLNKVMVIRSTVKPREKSPEEGSEDRRATATK